MIIAMLLAHTAIDCSAFDQDADRPVAILARSIAAEELAPAIVTAEEPGAKKIGELLYRGKGLALQSADPRFAEIEVGNTHAPTHPCGYIVQGPSGWDFSGSEPTTKSMRFLRGLGRQNPGSIAAAAAGAVPHLPGAVPGPTWPMWSRNGQYFLGVMPAKSTNESAIVAFAGRSGKVPARELARIRMRVTSFSVVPDLHRPTTYLHLSGRAPEGSLWMIVLEMPGSAESRLRDLGPEPLTDLPAAN